MLKGEPRRPGALRPYRLHDRVWPLSHIYRIYLWGFLLGGDQRTAPAKGEFASRPKVTRLILLAYGPVRQKTTFLPLTTDSRRVAGESVVRVVAQRRALEECLEDGTRTVPQLDGGGGVGSVSELFTRLPSGSAHLPRARCRALHRRASKTNALTSTAFCMLVEISHGVHTGHGETP